MRLVFHAFVSGLFFGFFTGGFPGCISAISVLALAIGHLFSDNYDSAIGNNYRYHSWQVISRFDAGFTKRSSPQKLRRSLMGRNYNTFPRLVFKPTPDYMPSNHVVKSSNYYHYNYYGVNTNQIYRNRLSRRYQILPHHAFQMRFCNFTHQSVVLPIVKYPHTIVKLNGKILHHPEITQIGALKVKPRQGPNRLTVQYHISLWYRIGIWISLIGSLILLICVKFCYRFF